MSFGVGDQVMVDGTGPLVIIGIARGWVEIEGMDKKIRANQLSPVPLERKENKNEDEDEGKPSMSSHFKKYRKGYTKSKSALGNNSAHNNDPVALSLVGLDWEIVCSIADELAPQLDGTPHSIRYANLNVGQRRMNAGNRLRGALKKNKISVEDINRTIQYGSRNMP